MSGVTPNSLILPESTPKHVKAYRRRFSSPCTNVASAGPDGYMSIYPDTGTPGTFIDPASTYLLFDLEILNTNFMVDYQNFGVEGALGAILQDFRIYNQGTILEEIMEYGTVASAQANMDGQHQQEQDLYFSNKLKNGYVGSSHKNFIKPPMCDGRGNPMHAINPFGLGYSQDGVGGSQYRIAQAANGPSSQCLRGKSSVIVGINAVGNGLFSNPACTTAGATWASRSLLTPGATVPLVTTPMDWPDFYSADQSEIVRKDYTKTFGSVNKAQVMTNMANVKCFPIGMRPGGDCYSTTAVYGAPGDIHNATSHTTSPTIGPLPEAKSSKIRVCAQFLSGLLGRMAPKMFASMLMGPMQLYISLHLASASVALKLSSDPCRRLTNTIRDYVRNVGTRNGGVYGGSTYTQQTDTTAANVGDFFSCADATDYAPGYGPFRKINMVAGDAITENIPSAVFGEASCSGDVTASGAITILSMGDAGITTAGVLTLVTPTNLLVPGMHFSMEAPDLANAQGNLTGVILAKTGDGKYATTAVVATEIAAGDLLAWSPAENRAIGATPQYMLTKEAWKYKRISGVSAVPIHYAIDTEMFYGTRLEASVPQVKRMFYFNSPTGTTSSATSIPVVDPTYSGVGITYNISNLALVGDQIILPDDIAAGIVDQASSGQFNVHTNSIRSYIITPAQAITQSIILPCKVAQATALFVAWQNNAQRAMGSGMYYDSNCSYNPFASIAAGAGATNANFLGYNTGTSTTTGGLESIFGVGFDIPLVYTPTNTGQDALSLQLRIGNEMYPPTPLTTMVEVVAEYVKAKNGWEVAGYSPDVNSRIGQTLGVAGTLGAAGAAPSVSALPVYDCLEASKYCTAFVPYALLDDQTIMGNNDTVPLYSKFDGAATMAARLITTGIGVVNGPNNGHMYQCPRGFCLDNMFEVPSGRHLTAFNLSQFKPSDGVDSGTYLGNNTITLQMGRTHAFASNGDWRGVVIVPHRALVKYQAGGQMIWNY